MDIFTALRHVRCPLAGGGRDQSGKVTRASNFNGYYRRRLFVWLLGFRAKQAGLITLLYSPEMATVCPEMDCTLLVSAEYSDITQHR